MRAKLTVASDVVLVDLASNNLTIVSVCDEINAAVYPAVHPRLTFLSVFEQEEGDAVTTDVVVRMQLEQERLFEAAGQIDFRGAPRTRMIAQFEQVYLPRPGILRISVLRGGEELTAWTIPVQLLPQPAQVVAPAQA